MAFVNDIRELAESTAKDISSSPRDWMGYLDTAARLYRYPFLDTLLIHAQRPDATACASLELWNKKMNRWVNRGAKGIALIDDTGPRRRLRYVFDISDTHMAQGGRTPDLWKIEERHREAALAHLTDAYGLSADEAAELPTALFGIACHAADDGMDEAMDGIFHETDGTFLEGLDEGTVRTEFRYLLTYSVFYILAARCGLEPMDYMEEGDFSRVTDYNALSVLSFLGNAAAQLAEPVLVDIGRTVRKIILEEYQKKVAKSPAVGYNQFNTLKRKSKNKNQKGENEYGTGLPQERGLPVPEPGDRGDGGGNREIRDAAPDVPQGEPEGMVSEHDAIGETGQASGGDRESGVGKDGNADGKPGTEIPGPGQGERPAGMGGAHERADGDGGRERPEGIGVHLSEENTDTDLSGAEEETASALSLPALPTVEQQKREIEQRVQALYAGEIAIPADVVDEVLRRGGNQSRSRLRIIYNFMIDQTPEEYTEFIRKEYGTGGVGMEIGGAKYSVWHDELGMQIAAGHTVSGHVFEKVFLSWEDVSGRIHQLLRQGEYAPQSVLDAARSNALKEHATALADLEHDMADGISEIVFEDQDTFRGGFPDVVERLEGLLEQPGYLPELIECLEGLTEAYKDDPAIMRFKFYNPPKILAQFKKFQKEAVPYQARDGFAWREHSIFITQDEIDVFLQRGGAYSDGRLAIYAFFIQDKTKKEKEAFIKETYGIGGSSHALSGADDSDAWYDGKGIRLRRGHYENPDAEILLKWPKVAKRIEFLIENGSYLKSADYSRMPVYERQQMAGRVMTFYHHLPMDIMRPWEGNPDMLKYRDDVVSLLSNPDGQEGLLRHMDEALASLPLDYENYERRVEILADIHAYVEGTYTIFPEKKKEEAWIKDGGQLSLFDFMVQEKAEEKKEKAEEKQEKAEELPKKPEPGIEDTGQAADGGRTGRYEYGTGNFIYLDTGHLYRIKGVRNSHVYVEDMEHPDHRESIISLESYDGRLSACPELNRHWLTGGNTLKRDSRTIYKECLYTALTAVRNSPAYDVICSRDTDADMAYDIVREELDSLLAQNWGNAPAMAEAYGNWENFQDWIAEDIFQRTYQDYPSDSRDAVALHQYDPSAPEWSRGMLVEAEQQGIKEFPKEAQETAKDIGAVDEPETEKPLEQAKAAVRKQSGPEELRAGEQKAEKPATVQENPEGAEPEPLREEMEPGEEELIEDRLFQAMEEADVYLDDFSPEQVDVIYEAAEKDLNLVPMLNPEFPPEQMQLIADVVERMAAEGWAAFGNEVGPLTDHVMGMEEINGARKDRRLPLEPVSDETVQADDAGIQQGWHIVESASPQPERETAGREKINFHITDDDLGAGGLKQKFRYNMDAIFLLKKLEAEKRLATPEEQETLSRFVGWGGIPSAFDEKNKDWTAEYTELKTALTPEEYREARASTLNAFYTSPAVIKAMYEALGNMGLQQGNVLEPSCGIGNFMGLVPESMEGLKMYGVELDSVSGRIAKQLYQKNNISIQGFEKADYPESFFDCVVGNVPFGAYKVADRKYDRFNCKR